MKLGWRRLGLRIALLLVVAATVGSLAFVFYSRNPDSADALVSVLVVVATAAAACAATWLWLRARSTGTPRLPSVDELADQLRQKWEDAADKQGLTHPAPIPLQWQWSPRQVVGLRAEAVKRPFTPLPGMSAVTAEDLQSGTLKDLLGVYGGLGSGRLIVLGEPGAGKSGAGIQLLLDALDHRATLTTEEKTRVPVPVLVTPHGWDSTEPFAEWLATRLTRDHALLRAPEYGGDAALRLIKGGHLAVILDGLDEMPEPLRAEALRELEKQATFRLVVLTRTEELVAEANDAQLRGAAAIELQPIDPRQAAEYLASCHIGPPPAPWQRLIDHLREYPDGVLAQALTTPLMLTLVRDTYYGPEEQIDELIDGSRFATREAVEDYLLDRELTATYTRHPDPRYDVHQARRWLGQLACRMDEEGTRDLTLPRILRWMPVWPRAFATVAVMSVVSMFLIGPLIGLAAHLPFFSAFRVGSLTALSGQMLGYVFMFGPGLLLMSPPGGRSPQPQDQLWRSKTDFRTILLLFLLGVGVGVGAGLERGFSLGLERGLLIGFISSFVVGLGFVLSEGPPQQLGWLRWSKTDTRANLFLGLVVGLAAGLAAGLGSGLLYGFLPGPLYGPLYGLRVGLVYGFVVGIGYMFVIVIGGRLSEQRSQLWGSRIDILPTLLIGLVIATVTTVVYGIIYVLIVILGRRTPLQRSRLRWREITTPTTFLTGLVLGLVLGLVYVLAYVLAYGLEDGIIRSGIKAGLVLGLSVGLLLGFSQPPTEATSSLDPPSLRRRQCRVGIVFGLVVGIVFGFASKHVVGLAHWPVIALVFGLGSALMSSTAWATALASPQPQRRGEASVRVLTLLEDARDRRILRTVGPAYQFRYHQLQHRLAETHETVPGEANTGTDASTLIGQKIKVRSGHRSRRLLWHSFVDGMGSIFDLTGTAMRRREREPPAWEYLDQLLAEEAARHASDTDTTSSDDWAPGPSNNKGKFGR